MRFIEGVNRHQILLFPNSLEESIEANNEVRNIDIYIEMLDLEELGFDLHKSKGGRPAYNPADIIKLFIYGAVNRNYSARALEKSCKRNIEVMWLIKCLQPDHNTLYNFKKANAKAIKKCIKGYRIFSNKQKSSAAKKKKAF